MPGTPSPKPGDDLVMIVCPNWQSDPMTRADALQRIREIEEGPGACREEHTVVEIAR